jgi:hypothetical protein
LEQVILHHVAQSARSFVVAGAHLNSERFRCRELHLVDVVRVPEGRENRVCKSQDQYVLRGFLAEEMINPISLLFGEGTADDAIEFPR